MTTRRTNRSVNGWSDDEPASTSAPTSASLKDTSTNSLRSVTNGTKQTNDDDNKDHKRALPSWRIKLRWALLLAVLVMGVLVRRRIRVRRLQVYRLVVSLTSTPDQLPALQPVLSSLIDDQQRPPNKVYLTLPMTEHNDNHENNNNNKREGDGGQIEYVIPDFIQEYVRQHKVLILYPEVDLGPVNKMIYAVEMESFDTRIVYIDSSNKSSNIMTDGTTTSSSSIGSGSLGQDPRRYPSDFLLQLQEVSMENPDAVVAYDGWNFQDVLVGIGTRKPMARVEKRLNGHRRVDVAQGGGGRIRRGGICVQRRFFDIESFQRDMMSTTLSDQARLADDVLVAAHIRHVPVIAINDRTVTLTGEEVLQAMAAAKYAQTEWGVWNDHTFVDPDKLSDEAIHAIMCIAKKRDGNNSNGSMETKEGENSIADEEMEEQTIECDWDYQSVLASLAGSS